MARGHTRLRSLAAHHRGPARRRAGHATRLAAARDRARPPDPMARHQPLARHRAPLALPAVRALPGESPHPPQRRAAHRSARRPGILLLHTRGLGAALAPHPPRRAPSADAGRSRHDRRPLGHRPPLAPRTPPPPPPPRPPPRHPAPPSPLLPPP